MAKTLISRSYHAAGGDSPLWFNGDPLSITGSAVTPEFHTYGILPDGTRWSRAVQGETANAPRFTKRYENLLGQAIREERSGFQGAVLATTHAYDSLGRIVSTSTDYEPIVEYTYDTLGNRIATTRVVGRAVSTKPPEWRKTETTTAFTLDGSIVWLAQTNIVSCSDSAIAPLITSSARQLTGLTSAIPARSRSTDVRGNVTTNEMLVDAAIVTSRQTVPYATNKPLAISRYGVSLKEVSVSAVTNTVAYDSLGRQISTTDGRGNTRHTEYNALGQRVASIDALGNRTTYAYNQFGTLASVTDPLGHATVYEYDLRGRKTYEGGATYPIRYTYDVFGNKTTMMTYRNESLGPDSGDVTTWLYDEASGSMTNKVYADGKGPIYSYTPDGKLSRRIWARGIVTDYAYDSWNSLTNTVYSNDTPAVSLSYDALGRQTEVHDAAGVTTFAYDAFDLLTSETVIGIAGTNVIERFWDDYGRTLGYALNGTRQSTLAYEPTTGRLAMMLATGSDIPFRWNYLEGSDLKSSLVYPNGLTASWQYGANNQLLQVCNTTSTNTISQYDYIYDVVGRRINMLKSGTAFDHDDTFAYGYNARGELTNAIALVDADYRCVYDYDDIGNRKTSSERGTNVVCAFNSLNQYTAVDDFTPQFDDDGNQTLIKTATGIWVVQYNGENRPVLWENISINSPAPNSFAPTHITMSFDRMGRRVTKNKQAFIYDGYLQIANSKGNVYIWDPSERVATRPLVWEGNGVAAHHMHDGNKNVTEVISVSGDVLASYEYAAFGTTITQSGVSAAENTWRFSSECAEDDTVTVYYNYRHYDPARGRWMQRDLINEEGGVSLYSNNNDFIGCNDVLGLETIDREKYFLDLIKAPSGDYIIKVVKITEENKWKRQIGLNALRKTFASIDCTYFKNANTSQGTMRIPQEMVNHFSEFAKPGDEVVVPYSEGIRTATFLLDVIWAIKKEPTKYNELIQAMTNYTEDKSEASCYSLCGALVDYFGSLSGPLEGVVKYATGLSCVDACVNAGCKDCGEE